jgi:hypothetical protein
MHQALIDFDSKISAGRSIFYFLAAISAPICIALSRAHAAEPRAIYYHNTAVGTGNRTLTASKLGLGIDHDHFKVLQ